MAAQGVGPATRTSPAPILEMLAGRWVSSAVTVAARLGVADALAAGTLDAEQLAAEIEAHPGSLERLLRALASLGLVVEDASRRFALTPLGELLRRDVPGSLYGMLRWFAAEEHGAAHNALAYSVRSGDSAWVHVHGRDVWSYLAGEPELEAIFTAAMAGFAHGLGGQIEPHVELPRGGTIVDVGGSDGAVLAEFLARRAGVRGIVFDRPRVAQHARRDATGVLRERCSFVGGDFFAALPPGDAYLLSHILHDWADESCVRILERCRAAMRPGGRVYVAEAVIGPGNDPDFAKLLDLEMLVITAGGRERTRDEFEHLFERAGLRLARVTRLPSGTSLIEAA